MVKKKNYSYVNLIRNFSKFYFTLFTLFLFIFLLIQSSFSTTNTSLNMVNNSINISNQTQPKISLKLYSPKLVYPVGSNVNLSLILTNNYSIPVFGQIRGKVIIGNVGYNILCYEHTFEGGNKTTIMRLGSLPATFSTSNLKSLTTVYQCGGTSSESTKTFFDNLPINHSPNIETFTIESFNFTYTYNNKTYVVKSNSLKITVVSAQQNSQSQNSNSQSNSNNNNNYNNNQNSNKNEQSTNTNGRNGNNEGSNLNNRNNYNSGQQNQNMNSQQMQRTQANAVNSQQNSQTINQIKKEIENSKKNVLNNLTQNPENGTDFWILLIIILLVIAIMFAYYIYSRKNINEDIEENEEDIKRDTKPLYFELLEKAEKEDNIKEKSKYLSQAIRTYIADKNGIDKEITHSKAIKLTKNKYFKDLLNKLEKIEFTNEKYILDYKTIIKKVRGEFENERKE